MRSILLDTNVLINFLERGHDELSTLLSGYEQVVLTPTVIGEYRAGIHDNERGRKSERALAGFLADENVIQLSISPTTATYYARIYQSLKSSGGLIPVNDIWIAASAQEHAVELCTYDAHFGRVPKLRVVKAESSSAG